MAALPAAFSGVGRHIVRIAILLLVGVLGPAVLTGWAWVEAGSLVTGSLPGLGLWLVRDLVLVLLAALQAGTFVLAYRNLAQPRPVLAPSAVGDRVRPTGWAALVLGLVALLLPTLLAGAGVATRRLPELSVQPAQYGSLAALAWPAGRHPVLVSDPRLHRRHLPHVAADGAALLAAGHQGHHNRRRRLGVRAGRRPAGLLRPAAHLPPGPRPAPGLRLRAGGRPGPRPRRWASSSRSPSPAAIRHDGWAGRGRRTRGCVSSAAATSTARPRPSPGSGWSAVRIGYDVHRLLPPAVRRRGPERPAGGRLPSAGRFHGLGGALRHAGLRQLAARAPGQPGTARPAHQGRAGTPALRPPGAPLRPVHRRPERHRRPARRRRLRRDDPCRSARRGAVRRRKAVGAASPRALDLRRLPVPVAPRGAPGRGAGRVQRPPRPAAGRCLPAGGEPGRSGDRRSGNWFHELRSGERTPWGEQCTSPTVVAAVESSAGAVAVERDHERRREAEAQNDHGGRRTWCGRASPAPKVYLILDGIFVVEVDDQEVAEIGPGAVVGRAGCDSCTARGRRCCGRVRRAASPACRTTRSTRRRLGSLAAAHRREE